MNNWTIPREVEVPKKTPFALPNNGRESMKTTHRVTNCSRIMHACLISKFLPAHSDVVKVENFRFRTPSFPRAIQSNNSWRSKVVGDFASRREVDVRWEGKVSLFLRVRIRLTTRFYATVNVSPPRHHLLSNEILLALTPPRLVPTLNARFDELPGKCTYK